MAQIVKTKKVSKMAQIVKTKTIQTTETVCDYCDNQGFFKCDTCDKDLCLNHRHPIDFYPWNLHSHSDYPDYLCPNCYKHFIEDTYDIIDKVKKEWDTWSKFTETTYEEFQEKCRRDTNTGN